MDLPVTVVGGYLGAGKTTLVNHLLRHPGGLRLAVLVNEFGALPIDADLIEAEEGGLISISGGCVCCAFGADLIGALEDIQAMTPRPDHVLIEASGVALPGAIATTVSMIAGLRADAVLVLADAEQIRANAASPYLSDTIDRQLAQADIVLVTKADLVTEGSLADVTAWLKARAPRARLLPVAKGRISAAAVLGALPLPSSGPRDTASHDRFASAVLTAGGPVDAGQIARTLADDAGITRAKGYLPTLQGLALIQVTGPRCTVEPAKGGHATGLVCIGPDATFDPARLCAATGLVRSP